MTPVRQPALFFFFFLSFFSFFSLHYSSIFKNGAMTNALIRRCIEDREMSNWSKELNTHESTNNLLAWPLSPTNSFMIVRAIIAAFTHIVNTVYNCSYKHH